MQRTDLGGHAAELLIGIDPERLDHRANRWHEALLRTVCGHARDQLREQRHRVASQRGDRGVPCLPERGHGDGQRRLLTDLQRVDDTAVDELEADATTLVDGVVAPEVRPLLEQPGHADLLHAVLLVRLRDQQQIAARLKAGAGEVGDRHAARGELVLHVAGAATPDEALVVEVRVKRRMRPVGRVSGHDVGVPHQRERRPRAAAGQAGDQVGPVGIASHQLTGHAVGLEVLLDDQRGRRLASRRVRRIDPHELAQELDGLVAESDVHVQNPTRPRRRARSCRRSPWR